MCHLIADGDEFRTEGVPKDLFQQQPVYLCHCSALPACLAPSYLVAAAVGRLKGLFGGIWVGLPSAENAEDSIQECLGNSGVHYIEKYSLASAKFRRKRGAVE